MRTHILSLLLLIGIVLQGGYIYPQNQADSTVSLYIYLIRGIGRESGHWGADFGERLLAQFPNAQLVYIDLPGSGEFYTQKALKNIPETTRFLRDKYKYSLDQEGTHVLLSTSLAGILGMDWMIQYPNDFDGLTLVSTSSKKLCLSNERVKPNAKKKFLKIFFTRDLRKREERFLEINSNYYMHNDSILDSWVSIQKKRPISHKNLFWQTIAGKRYKLKGDIPQVPILIVGSYGDQIVAPNCLRKLKDYLHAELRMHPNAGHGIPIDDPVWLADIMTEWIKYTVLRSPASEIDVVTEGMD